MLPSSFCVNSFLFALLDVILLTLSVGASPDLFSAVVDMERALQDEQSAAILLRHYVQNERQRLDTLERLADEWKSHSRKALMDVESHVFHPINYFLVTKRFTVDWPETVNKLIKNDTHTQEFLSQLEQTTSNYPNYDNFVMSASALLRLQDTYALSTTSLSGGQVGTIVNTAPAMTADDCFQLGRVAYNNNDFYHAFMWINEALRLDSLEETKTTSRTVLLDYFSFCTFKQGNLRHAFNLTSEWLTLEPGHSRAASNLEFYRIQIQDDEDEKRRNRQVVVIDDNLKNEKSFDAFRSTPEFSAYEQLCRGDNIVPSIQMDPNTRRDLVCKFRRHLPMFYIRPLKEELVNLSPRIVVYHDIITDAEIEKIKQLATPKLHRSGVFLLKGASDPTAAFTTYRTSKSAWLEDVEDPLIARVSRKAHGLSNLTLETAEQLQVLNYGIGGHYEPHYDFTQATEEASFSEWQGNRVATVVFYLNDVDAGGFTVFNLLGIGQPASKGSCILWYNLLTSGEVDYRTRHAGCPVLVGTKWVANKWFHYGGQQFSRPCSTDKNNNN